MAKKISEIPCTLGALLARSAALYGTKTALQEKRDGVYQAISFARLEREAALLSRALLLRIAPGTRVLLVGENATHWVVGLMALALGGYVAVPVDASLSAKELQAILRETDAGAVLYGAEQRKKRRAFVGRTAVCFDKFDALVAAAERLPATDVSAGPDDVAAIFHTPGTTGRAKSVMLSHRALLAAVLNMDKMMRFTREDLFLSVLPLSHVYEFVCGLLAPLYFGATVAFCEGVDHLLRNMREVHPTCMVTIPYIARALLEGCWREICRAGRETAVRRAITVSDPVRPLAARQTLKERVLARERALFGGSLRKLLILGGAMDAAVQKGLRQLGVFAVQGYGMTECAGLVALSRDEIYCDGAAGLPIPGTMLDIYDAQPDGSGEIRYKGDNVMLGYLDDPERTARVLRDGWYYTGDVGRFDENGFLHVLGRRQNCLVTAGGLLISPEELERLLSQSPFIAEAAVVGVLAEDGKDCQPAAWIVPDVEYAAEVLGEGFDEVELEAAIDEWITGINQGLLPYQQIGLYALRGEPLARDAAGRILRGGLTEEFSSYRPME